MGIKYHTDGRYIELPNGSRCYYTPGPFNSVAKVEQCPCQDGKRRNVFATAEPDTFFTIPACVYVGSKTVSGYLQSDEDGWRFVVIETSKNAALITPLFVST